MSWLFWWRPPCLLRRVIVNFTHDDRTAFEGVLWRYRGGWITLREVQALATGQNPEAVKGDVVIERTKIAYFQVMP